MSSSKESEKTPQTPKVPFYKDVDGFRLPGFFSTECYKSALDYKPRPDDLFVVTYPKCGTTWVQVLVGSILRKGRPISSVQELSSESPFLEMAGAEGAIKMKRPGSIKTHLPFSLAPYSHDAKYIFVARNPKDCVVSFYHHTKTLSAYKFENGEFDDYFELFMEGKVEFGDYFDTLLSWYEHRNDPNVLFLTYEQLKKDTRSNVLKIAEFIGPQHKEALEKDERMLDDVIRYSSFKYMKGIESSSFAELASIPVELIVDNSEIPLGFRELLLNEKFRSDPSSVCFVRKGVVGDWKNYFSPMQDARLMRKYRERTLGTDIPELWKDIL